jgi:hypothetical protein
MLLLFCLLGLVASEPMLRSDLHNLKRLENERRNKEIINLGFSQIQNDIILRAKAGETKLQIPFAGCNEEFINFGISGFTIEDCEYIVNEIKEKGNINFPDTAITYDETKKIYFIDWS